MELSLCYSSGTYNFDVSPIFLKKRVHPFPNVLKKNVSNIRINLKSFFELPLKSWQKQSSAVPSVPFVCPSVRMEELISRWKTFCEILYLWFPFYQIHLCLTKLS
jgi:hypothetical protein